MGTLETIVQPLLHGKRPLNKRLKWDWNAAADTTHNINGECALKTRRRFCVIARHFASHDE